MWPFSQARRAAPRTLRIDTPRLRTSDRSQRVTATTAGRRVWFESADAPLRASSEAFGAALLLPALHAGRSLAVRGSVCPTWAANLEPLAAAYRQLWYPDAPAPQVSPEQCTATAAAPGTALCFSGGVDAFHTLLAGGRPVDTLVYVAGYDVSLRDTARLTAVERLLREVAASSNATSVVVRSNLRRHPLVRATPWRLEFGAALAAVGHVLTPHVGRLLISSDGLGFEHPGVGSRVSTDPLLGSAALTVEHVAAQVTRLEKLRAIGGEPLVQRHLRVCWQNVAGKTNCGRCEKCVRTMLMLDVCGTLGQFPGFDHGRHLSAAVDALPQVDDVVAPFYRDLLTAGLTAHAAASVRRLVDRSVAVAARPRRGSREPLREARHRLLGPEAFAHVCEPLVGRKVGYVRPVGNVGDHLIELAMTQLFAIYGIDWSLVNLDDGPQASAGLDLLVFGGGGNMGTRYEGNYDLRSRALATGLPLVILPQSFTTTEDRPFERVHVRERGSLAYCPTGILAPDLALGLAWPEPPPAVRDLGVYLRRDQERGGRKPLLARDPVRLAATPGDYLAFAARHKRIVTDRLHFAVAGLHAGRDVTLVANDYHKNRSMHETWLADLGCRFAESAAEALHRGRRAA
ncbi:MAG: polysaccharide pyruvyl transferase family protein [Planctomycetia bacterium]|nr:polysaccharide pyruvyl transferase family protein [Planctomycetia bacterium]